MGNMGFKVIIIGGGLAGLALAHCLTKADIDFIVLERNENICIEDGSSLALWPHNARILDQLGLLEEAQQLDCNVKYKHNVESDGSVLQRNNMLEKVGIRLGHHWMCFLRPRFLRLLYDSLPDRGSRVLGGKAMATIETTPDGVRVTCNDGSVHEGSIVVGADGVNSSVRRHLSRGLSDERLAGPFTTSYLGLFGWSRWTGDFPEATLREVHADKFSIQVIPGRDIIMFMVYQRLPTKVRGSVRSSKEEKEAIANSVGDVNITESIRFKDIWDKVQWSYCSGLEEGLAQRWYGDRVVLVGDTVHKMTPNIGLGLNSGWQSAVILTNSLRRLLQEDPAPSTEALKSVFKKYHNSRKRGTLYAVFLSGLYTRLVAWNNPLWGFVDRHVTNLVGGDCKLLDLLIVPLIRRGTTLDFLDEDHFRKGSADWAKGRTTPQQPRAAPTWKASSIKSKAISMLRWRVRNSEP